MELVGVEVVKVVPKRLEDQGETRLARLWSGTSLGKFSAESWTWRLTHLSLTSAKLFYS
jgi:hypothetical protein